MINKLYYYFIKTKYCDFTNEDIIKFKALYIEALKVKLSLTLISDINRSAIEENLIGKKLTENQRRADLYILSQENIIKSFIDYELGKTEIETDAEFLDSLKNLREMITRNLKKPIDPWA